MTDYVFIKKEQSYQTSESYDLSLSLKPNNVSILKKGEVYPIIDYHNSTEYYVTETRLPIIKMPVSNETLILSKDSYIILTEAEAKIYKQEVVAVKSFNAFPCFEDSNRYNLKGISIKIGQEILINGFVEDFNEIGLFPYFEHAGIRYVLFQNDVITKVILETVFQQKIYNYDY